MSDLYSVIPGLQPNAQDVLEAELLAKQILEAKYPTLDLREGTGLRDLLIRPLAVFVALAKSGTDYLFTQNRLSDVTDATPPDLVDSILSNWFLTRKIGTKSVISSRLYFSRRKNVNISTDIYFSTDNTLKFYPVASATYGQDTLVFDSFSNEFYVDTDLVAEKEGATYNIGSGSLLYFSNFDPYFLRAEINYLKEASVESESNTEFINRAKTAISTRNLINQPSIDSNLKETFNYIKRLVTVGMGDEEMIRDQIKAVFEPEIPRALESLTSTGTTATATLTNCNLHTGQPILIAGAVPTGYNGQFTVDTVSFDSKTFTYTLGSSQSAVTNLPTVVPVKNPVYIHNGGMVDVYCSDSLATAIVQVTLDAGGQAHLTGPIYEVSRSAISGGGTNDTVPQNNTATITSWNIVGQAATATSSNTHYFVPGDTVTISGAHQSVTVNAISCTGTTVTVTTAVSHGYQIGDSVTISGVTPTSYNGTFTIASASGSTFTYTVPANIASSGSGTMSCEVNLLNGNFAVTLSSSNTFTINLSRTTSLAVTTPGTGSSPIDFYLSQPYTKTDTIVSAVPNTSDNSVIVTIPSHGLSRGRYVNIQGSTYSGYNGWWRIDSVTNQDQFVIILPTNMPSPSTAGTATSVIPWYDYGFSQKQDQIVSMGVNNAGKTASFVIKYFQYLDSIQSYLDSSSNRVLCGDYLARGFNFYLLSVTIASYNGPAPDSSVVTSVITDYLSSMNPGDMFVMSDMVAKLRINGIINIQNPPLVTYKQYNRDLVPVKTGTITDILDPDDSTNIFLLDSVTTTSVSLNSDTLNIT